MSGADGGLRPVDLARAAGVSSQQIRNYEDAGILPAAVRTAAGHRRYGTTQWLSLLAFRALARGCGPQSAQQILQAVHGGDLPGALAVVDAGHSALHEERLSLQATGEALEAVAGRPPDATPRAGMRIGEVARHLGVRASALRVWEAAGLLGSEREPGTGYRRYRPADVRDAGMIAMLRRAGYRLPQIRPILEGLRREGSTEALRSAVVQRQAALTQRSAAMLEGAGHLHRLIEECYASERRSASG